MIEKLPDNADRQTPSSKNRWFGRVILLCAVLALLVIVAHQYVLPAIVRSKLLAELHAIGLTEADLVIHDISTNSAYLSQLTLDAEGRAAAHAIRVTYTLSGLTRGQLDTITLNGVTLSANITDNTLDLGPLKQIRFAKSSASKSDLPFNMLTLQAGRLAIHIDDQTHWVPIDASIERVESGKFRVLAETEIMGHHATVSMNLPQTTLPWTIENLQLKTAYQNHPLRLRVDRVTIDNDKLALAAGHLTWADTTLQDVALAIPFTADSPGAISIANTRYRDTDWPELHGSITRNENTWQVQADWPIVADHPLRVQADLSANASTITANLPATPLAALRPVLEKFTTMNNIKLGGNISLDAKYTTEKSAEPNLTINLHDAFLHHPAWQTKLSGVHGSVAFNQFAPLATTTGQQLAINRYEQGQVILTDGKLRFRVDSPRNIFVERTDWTFGGDGRVTAHAIHYNADRPTFDTELFIDNLNLQHWVSVLTHERVKATGNLYGRMPVKINPAEKWQKLSFGKGFLYSSPGMGSLQFADAERVSQLLAQADPRFTQDPQMAVVRQRIASALTDFQYELVKFDMIPEPTGQAMLKVQTKGQGRGPNGQEIAGLVINYHNFTDTVNMALFARQGLGGAVGKRLEDFFEPLERPARKEPQP